MSLPDRIAIIVLGLLWAGQLLLRVPFLTRRLGMLITPRRWFLGIAAGGATAIFGISFWYSYLQYRLWAASELTKFFLPPYRDGWYFIRRVVVSGFVGPWVAALLAAAIGFLVLRAMNQKYDERFFEPEEYAMFAVGIFFSGYPGFLSFVPLVLVFGVVLTAVFAARSWGRAPFYDLWFATAILAILLEHWLVPQALLSRFVF